MQFLSIHFKFKVLITQKHIHSNGQFPVNTFHYLKDYRKKKSSELIIGGSPSLYVRIPYTQWAFYRYARLTNPAVITSMNWCKYTDFLLFFKIVGIDQFIWWFAQLLKKIVYLNSNQSLAHQRASFFGSVRWSKVVFRCLFCWSYLKNLYIGFGINTMTFFNLKKQQAV